MALTLSHYRFGIDELAESTHGWHAVEDANPAQGVIAVDVNFLLRFTVQANTTGLNNVDNEFQYRKNSGTWTNITTTSGSVKAVAVTPLTNGSDCTKRLSGTGTFEATGAGQTEDGSSGGTANDIVASGNSETECGLQIVGTDVAHGDVLEFRLTRDGGTLLDTYSVVPTITVNKPTTVSGDGSSAGLAASAVVGLALFLAAAAGAGTSTVTASGLALLSATASAVGAATAEAVGYTFLSGAGSSDGSATVSAVGGSVAASGGASSGVGTSSGIGSATGEGAGASAGICTPDGTGGSTAEGSYVGAGTSTATGDGAATTAGQAASDGTATATAEGTTAGGAEGAGASAGTGAADGVGAATTTATAASDGSASGSAVGGSVSAVEAVGSAVGSSEVGGVGIIVVLAVAITVNPKGKPACRYIPLPTDSGAEGGGGSIVLGVGSAIGGEVIDPRGTPAYRYVLPQ